MSSPPRPSTSKLLALATGALLGTALVSAIAFAVPMTASPYRNLGVFARALAHIEMSYVEDVDQDSLIHGAIRGMVGTLDPHSAFMDPDEYRILTSDTEGRFAGVGVEIEVKDGWILVVRTFEGGPAARAGLMPGDRFLTIGGRDARDMRVDEAVRRMRGEPGTKVKVRIRRANSQTAVPLELTREIIRVRAVDAMVLPDRIAYVHIKAFQETTTQELRKALDMAVAQVAPAGGLNGVLLDLRDNAGGLLDEAVLVADEFLERGVIVSTRGRGGQLINEARATSRGTRPNWPMVVLVNGYSASAAEIVAGALRDHKRAVVVGTRTFGKGSVQNVIELPNGSAMKLTVARYYTPSGRSIQAEGIEPDVEVQQFASAERSDRDQLTEASLDRHLPGSAELRTRGGSLGREQPRTKPSASVPIASPFPNDLQANMAYQTVRVLALAAKR